MERVYSRFNDHARALQCHRPHRPGFSRGVSTMTRGQRASQGIACARVGEDLLLAKLLPGLRRSLHSVVLGAGDDCAIVRPKANGNLLLLKTDCLVEGIHFTAATPPVLIGWKAMARPLSDFAAMSGVPQFALITLI